MKYAFGLYDGDRLLTEVHAETEDQARTVATTEFCIVTFCDRANGETPDEYRSRLLRARVVNFGPVQEHTK
jgi:hypothetical protein